MDSDVVYDYEIVLKRLAKIESKISILKEEINFMLGIGFAIFVIMCPILMFLIALIFLIQK